VEYFIAGSIGMIIGLLFYKHLIKGDYEGKITALENELDDYKVFYKEYKSKYYELKDLIKKDMIKADIEDDDDD